MPDVITESSSDFVVIDNVTAPFLGFGGESLFV